MDIIDCKVIERVSNKSGNTYRAIELTFANGMKELFFPGRDHQRIGLLIEMPNP